MPDHDIRVNDPKYYMSEPKQQIGCTLPSAEDFDAAVAALVAHGIAPDELRALHGPEGAEILDLLGEHHGLMANLRRIFPTINPYIMENMGNADQALKSNGYALIAPADEYDDAKNIAAILRGHHAGNMFYFGKKKMWRIKS